jgi:3-oxoadipate enol-lactonase
LPAREERPFDAELPLKDWRRSQGPLKIAIRYPIPAPMLNLSCSSAHARSGQSEITREKAMPVVNANGCPIHVEVEGPQAAPVLMLSNSLGTTLHMWDDQIGPFSNAFRVVRYDRRGHGKSGLPQGPYSMELLARDALAILDALGIEKANWCGLSMGGMEGMWLGANAPHRIERMVLSNTSSYFPDKKGWNDRLALVKEKGVPAFAAPNMERWFTKGFRERNPQAIGRISKMFAATPLDGYLNCGMAVRDMDHRAMLPQIKVPTLVIIGRHDPATTPEAGEYLYRTISGSEHFMIDAAHISNVEAPQQFNHAVLDFLRRR